MGDWKELERRLIPESVRVHNWHPRSGITYTYATMDIEIGEKNRKTGDYRRRIETTKPLYMNDSKGCAMEVAVHALEDLQTQILGRR